MHLVRESVIVSMKRSKTTSLKENLVVFTTRLSSNLSRHTISDKDLAQSPRARHLWLALMFGPEAI